MANVLITGTSTGIGAASTGHLASRGWTVYAGVRRPEDGEKVKAEHAGDVRPVILDVGNRDDISRVVAEITTEVGAAGLQGLVNNAGIGVGGPFEYLTDEDWRRVFDINFFGVVALTKAALPLLAGGRGRIVHIGSVGGRIASAGLGPYSASKHAIEALAESQRQELAGAGSPIKVALIEPGEVKTAIWEKSSLEVDEMERRLDDDGRARYQWLVDQSRGFVEEGRTKGVPAVKVAEVIEHALTADRPKARYLVGQDAKLAGHVITRLPDRLRDVATELGARRWKARGANLRDGT